MPETTGIDRHSSLFLDFCAVIIDKLEAAGLIHPPKFLKNNCHYLTIMGSEAYGVSSGSSDIDIYGFCIPPKEMIFPHLSGQVAGFSTQVQAFEQWSEHHIPNPDGKDVTYDFAVYSIVKFFRLAMENNPNMVDALFTPRRCVIHSTQIGEMVRDQRKIFLHKGAFHKFRGYAYAQLAKIEGKVNASNPERAASIARHGYDVKFAYHIFRLCLECEQVMVEHDLDLERSREILKSIRRGEWTLDQIKEWFSNKEKALETVYATSTLRHSPDEDRIRLLLLDCLEHHYGTISTAIARNPTMDILLGDLKALIGRYDENP